MTKKLVTLSVSVPDAVPVKDLPAGTYFLPAGESVYRGVWQRASQEAVNVPPGTYLSIYLGQVDGLANGADPRYFDSSLLGHVLTRDQALALLAAQG